MNPWKIIGWIVLGFMLLVMYGCFRVFSRVGEAPSSSQSPAVGISEPSPRLRVEELHCTASPSGMAIIEGAMQNVGDAELGYTSIRFKLTDKAGAFVAYVDGYLSVAPLAVQASSPFKTMGDRVAYESCAVESATSRGKSIAFQ